MRTIRFEHSSRLEAPAERVWEFHMNPAALEQLSPRMMGLRIVDPGSGVADGSLVKAEVRFGPFRQSWHALHSGVRVNRGFTDMAIRSPFRYWVHQHSMEPVSHGQSRLTDVIWMVPPRWVPMPIARPLIKLGLRALFVWRHRRTRRAVETIQGPASSTLNPCSQP